MDDFNRNEKQYNFNQIRGEIAEFLHGEKFCSMTLSVGHENKRLVNLVIKKANFDSIKSRFTPGERVCAKFYLTSRQSNGRYATMANVLSVDKATD